jgi:hypothetical protein
MIFILHKILHKKETQNSRLEFNNGLAVSQRVIDLLYELVLMLSNLNRISLFSSFFMPLQQIFLRKIP